MYDPFIHTLYAPTPAQRAIQKVLQVDELRLKTAGQPRTLIAPPQAKQAEKPG
jgi:hypothetical protein